MRYPTLILGVLFSHLASAEATEVFLKARDQTIANWAEEVSKQFNAKIKKHIPGLDDNGNSQSLCFLSANSFLVKSVNQI